MPQSLVSVIIPCYNQAKYLPETLDSVINQTYQNWECIIVNDGSKDDSEAVALSYCEKDKRIHYYYKENSGVCDTRNYAVARSSGKYILPLDADDIIERTYLEKGVSVLESDNEVEVVYGRAMFFGAYNGEIILKPFDYSTLLLENVFYSTVLFRKDQFEGVGGYNANMHKGWEDWELMISMLNENSKVVKLPDICFFYRILPNSRERSISKELKEELFLQIYENHKDTYDRYFPNPIRFAFLNRQLENKVIEQQAVLFSLKNSKKFKAVQFLAEIAHRLSFWKKS